ncbi:MAG: ABC transporter permease [Desulfuromonadaceae bacterium]
MSSERVITNVQFDREFVSQNQQIAVTENSPRPLSQQKLFNKEKLWEYSTTLPQKSVIIVLSLIAWEILPRAGILDPVFLPALSTVIESLFLMITSGELLKHTLISFQRALIGFALATALAIPLAFLIGWFKTFEKYVDPPLQAFRQLPTLALFPVFILVFGIGEVSKIAIIAKATFWPIFLNTVSGVSQLDPLLVKSARSMGVKSFGMFWRVVLPASIPSMFSGLRLSATTALLMLVAAEMLGASSGIGFLIFNTEARFMIPEMYAAIMALTFYGIVLNYSLIAVQKRVSRWKEEIVHH